MWMGFGMPRRGAAAAAWCTASAVAALAHGTLASEANDPPAVTVEGGRVVGLRQDGYREFLGVPFAAPPTGKLRWLPPQPREPWAPEVWRAQEVSAGCQRSDTWYTLNPVRSEDCLYLNVWAPPAEVIRQPVPVIVWIFGGGYVTGSGDSKQTRGNQLVRTFGDVVVVTINYRLGVLGFLGSEELRRYTYERTGLNSTGNMGFLDQVMALRWVQQNIAAFGGDPSNVMIWGESAGAGAVSAHLVSPVSRGLFHKAAMQSGAFNEWVAMSLAHAHDNFNAMVKSMRRLRKDYPKAQWAKRYECGNLTSDLDCLVKSEIPADHLINIQDGTIYEYNHNSSDWDGMQQCQWGPIFDGVVLPDHPFKMLERGDWNPVPVIIGVNRDDGSEFVDGCKNGETVEGYATCAMNYKLYSRLYDYFFSDGEKINDPHCFEDPLYRKWLRLNWGSSNVDALYSIYNSSEGGHFWTNYWAAEHLVGDYVMYCTQNLAATWMAHNASVYEYYFIHTPVLAPFRQKGNPAETVTEGFGACHGCLIPFAFQRIDSAEYGVMGPPEEDLAFAVGVYWTNFAWTGDPNSFGSRWSEAISRRPPHTWWPPRAQAEHMPDAFMVFDAPPDGSPVTYVAQEHPRASRCSRFWTGYFQKTGWVGSEEPLTAPSSSAAAAAAPWGTGPWRRQGWRRREEAQRRGRQLMPEAEESEGEGGSYKVCRSAAEEPAASPAPSAAEEPPAVTAAEGPVLTAPKASSGLPGSAPPLGGGGGGGEQLEQELMV